MSAVNINPKAELTVEDFIKVKWEREQEHLKRQMLLEDVDDWSRHRITPDVADQFQFMTPLQFVGGVDISFVKGDNVNACAAFVVLSFPQLEVVYKDLSMIQLTAPYIPGFLAFREADFLVEKIQKLKKTQPDIMPQVILVDGNGILHPRGFGLACHLGVMTGLPTVGAAKNLFFIDGIERDEAHQMKIKALLKEGDSFPLIGQSQQQHGVAYRSCNDTTNPIYISPGNRISMDTAVWVTRKCIKYRVPEPTRQADMLSREYLRTHWQIDENPQKIRKKQKNKKNPNDRVSQEQKVHLQKPTAPSSDEETYLDLGIDLWDS